MELNNEKYSKHSNVNNEKNKQKTLRRKNKPTHNNKTVQVK